MTAVFRQAKLAQLRSWLREAGRVLIALSGGVDSTLLAKVAHDELGAGAVAVTVCSCLLPARELAAARAFCEAEGIEHLCYEAAPLEVPGLADNTPERCYLCKRALMGALARVAAELGVAHVLDGSNVDDRGQDRPGMRALRELGVESPLVICGFSKDDIRECAHALGLAVWDRPSAACLASRVLTGETLSEERLARIDAAEDFLRDLGLRQLRVRLLTGDAARIEADEEGRRMLAQAPELRARVDARLRELGFADVEPEVAAYRSGSMNVTSADHPAQR